MKEEQTDPIEIIDNHLSQFFDEDEVLVFHEGHTPEDENHIDVYWIKPADGNIKYSILLTVGASRFYQNMDKEIEQPNLIELAMLIPKDWDFKNIDWKDDKFWPIHHLRNLAKIPTHANTWLGFGHTVNWSNDESNFPGTNFNSSIIIPSINLPDDFINVQINESKKAYIYSVIPLYPEELRFKLDTNSNSLMDKFDKFNIEEIVDINRINTCEKNR